MINLITKGSIETKIASGLTLKQSLFDGVLNNEDGPDVVDFSASGKAQFLKELENIMETFVAAPAEQTVADSPTLELEAVEETITTIVADENTTLVPTTTEATTANHTTLPGDQHEQMQTMAKVMNQGMEFLSGMFKMATGKDLGLEGQKMEVDKETGEIVMRFKMPQF